MKPSKLLIYFLFVSFSHLPINNSDAAMFPDGWQHMEIEAKWETSEAIFNAIVNAFPDGGAKYGYILNVRWSGIPRKYDDIYYDNAQQDLFDGLHMFRHRQRLRTQANLSITDSVAQLQSAVWNLDWNKVQYKSTPTRLGSVWFRTEQGNARLSSSEVAATLEGNAPQPPYSAGDNPVALLLGDHPGFNFSGLNAVRDVHQYRYRIELKDPTTNVALFEISLDKIVTDPNGNAQLSFGVELELLRDGTPQEAMAQELFTIVQKLEREFCLQRTDYSKGGIFVQDATVPASARGTINGVIRLEDSTVVQEAHITFIKNDGSLSQCIASEADGSYQITLPEGHYLFRVPHPNKEDAVGYVDISPNTTVIKDMTLRDPRLTTVLLVRHAERGSDDPWDPNLTEEGWRRAKQLAHVARKAGVTAVYTTDFKRTRHTIEPLAKFYLNLEPSIYNPGSSQNLVDAIRSDHAGDVVLVAGHSNTLLPIANQFGTAFPESPYVNDFDNLLVIAERIRGSSAVNVINLQYGAPSNAPQPTADAASATQMTTLLLVRHDEEQAGSTQRPQALAHVAQKSGISAIYVDQNHNQNMVQPLINTLANIDAAIPYDPANVSTWMNNVLQTHAGEAVLISGQLTTLQEIMQAVSSDSLPVLDAVEYDNFYIVTVHRSTTPLESRLLALQYGLPSPQQNVSVVQVIDRTGSMSHRDDPSAPTYMESARAAAQNFIGLMAIGDQAGVVAFDDQDCDNTGTKAEGFFNLTELSDATTRTNAINSIDDIDYRGCTSIGAGIEFAQSADFLDSAALNQPHAMVLLTDGYENRTPWVRERPMNYSHLPATPNNVLPAVPDDIDIYTIALGPNADQPLLRDIADTTGGKFYEAPSILGLLSIYYQIHGDLVVSEMVDLETGLKQAGNDTRTNIIDTYASDATFILGWLQPKARMKLRLTAPNGYELDLSSPTVEIGSHSNHYYVKIQRPIPGNWTVRLLRTDDHQFPVDYTYAAFVKGTEKMWSFTPEITVSGECLNPRVRLFETYSERPISGATVKAIVTQPKTSRFSLNYAYVTAKKFRWHPRHDIVVSRANKRFDKTTLDPLPSLASNLEQYDRETLAQTGHSIFQYQTKLYDLYDDGNHDDAEENDGIYAACIDATQIAGGYNLRFEVTGVSTFGEPFTRKRLAMATMMPAAVDAKKTLVRADAFRGDDANNKEAAVIIVPMDRFGNVWGPGHASRISVTTTAGVLSGPIQDTGDGFYFQVIRSTKATDMGKVMVAIDGREMATKPTISFGWPYGPSVGVHLGAAVPIGSFSSDYDSDYGVSFDFDYHLTRQFSAVGRIGYNHFKAGNASVDDTYWWNISLNTKYELTTQRLRSYITGGAGLYLPEQGSNKPGINFGLGIDYSITPQWIFEIGIDYHHIFTSGGETNFIVPKLGLIHYF